MNVVACMVIAASLFGCSAFAEETETLKIVNWNVLCGFNHKKSVKQGANWIKKQAADLSPGLVDYSAAVLSLLE